MRCRTLALALAVFTVSEVAVAQAPLNDDCANPVPLALGMNGPFSAVNATPSSPPAAWCGPPYATYPDLWYTYTTGQCAGSVTIDSCGGAFMAISVWTACGGTEITCGSRNPYNLCGYARAEFVAAANTTYLVRAMAPQGSSFSLSVVQGAKMWLTLASPGGPTSIQADIWSGPPNSVYLLAVTVNPPGWPWGPLAQFYGGFNITWAELNLEIAAGPPFLGSLDACGNFEIGPFWGAPSGVTIWAIAFGFANGYWSPTSFTDLGKTPAYTIP
jgi:hypothetical protein